MIYPFHFLLLITGKSLGTESTERLFISGSYDCSFKIWSTGKSGITLVK